jgi:hypothetical protein
VVSSRSRLLWQPFITLPICRQTHHMAGINRQRQPTYTIRSMAGPHTSEASK